MSLSDGTGGFYNSSTTIGSAGRRGVQSNIYGAVQSLLLYFVYKNTDINLNSSLQ